MRLGPLALGQRRPRSGLSGLALALAAFLVLCGLLLLVAGSTRPGTRSRADELSRKTTAALRELQAAEEALDGTNYGKVKGHVRSAKEHLTNMLEEMLGSRESQPRR
jgi:hypothetical protein